MHYSLNDVRCITLKKNSNELIVIEGAQLPLSVCRIFIVKGKQGAIRGHHAHRQLTQYLICVHGSCEVTCDDGLRKKIVILNNASQALLLPPGIWAEQKYIGKDTVLIVACDAEYDESDYIRDYADYLQFRNGLL